jgi:fission process protein 1
MSTPKEGSVVSKVAVRITAEDLAALKALYDSNSDGTLSKEEIHQMVHDYNTKKITDKRILDILSRYDTDGDGHIDESEKQHLHHSISLGDGPARYAAYTLGLSRLFRYLAFTSDFGEALRPVVHARIVSGSYAVAFAYCFTDVGWEAYKTHKAHTDPKSEYGQGEDGKKYLNMTVTQVVVERSTFQAFASLAIPAFLIHQSVHLAKTAFHRLGRFTKWGPSVVGLSVIPLLPLCLDEPVEQVVEWGFHHYGPWAAKRGHEEDGHDKKKQD